MRDRVGEEFEGSVSAVTSFGIFVALDDFYVEGLVHISELGQDYFQFDGNRAPVARRPDPQELSPRDDRVKVKIVRVDLETSRIDFVLAGGAGGGVRASRAHSPRRRARS